MKDVNKLSHVVWDCKYHLVWCPKYRFKILKYSISDVLGYLKGKSAIKIFDRYSELKRRYWGRHFWVCGYYASTVGLDEEQIREYVRNQMKRDYKEEQLELFNKRK